MMQKGMLAVDMGASNGRVVWGSWRDGRLEMQEIHRFENVPIHVDGLMCWNLEGLLDEIRSGIRLAGRAGLRIDSIGLCSWGNTIGVLNAGRELLFTPIHYREPDTDRALDGLYRQLSRRELFNRTLFIPMNIQPSVVLRYLMEKDPEQMGRADRVLMISDLMNERLCGAAASEQTICATSGMVDMRTGDWNRAFMRELGIDPAWWPDIVPSGTPLAPLKSAYWDGEAGREPLVIAVAGHDTASAASVIDTDRLEDSLYLSCGTWSCMGCRVERALEGDAIFASGATNDLGVDGERHLRFNHTGLWILQECRRWWRQHGADYSHGELVSMAARSRAFSAFIDTEDALFFRRDDMPLKVQQYCRSTAQPVPQTPGEIARVILESLAMRYSYSAKTLSALSGIAFQRMHLLGGGSRNALLCQMTANALGIEVAAGPVEASTIGNFIQQGLVNGSLESRKRAVEMLSQTEQIQTFLPEDVSIWRTQYERAIRICGW